MSTCTPHPPLALTTPFSVPPSCTATLVLTTYTATTTISTSPPPGAPFSAPFTFTSTYLTTDLSAYGLVAGYATSPPGGGPRFHDAGCYPARYGELRGAWFLQEEDHRLREQQAQDDGGRTTTSSTCGLLPTYYSPGACPVSWGGSSNVIAVLGPTTGGGKREGGGEDVVAVETAATCCPPAFTIPPGLLLSGLAAGVPVYCESVIAAPTDVYAADAGSWTTVASGTVRAAAVEVHWREGDVPLLLGGNGGGGGGDGDGTLSAGAKAGIGVAAGLAGLGIAVVGLALYFRRRRRAGNGKGKEREQAEFGAEKDEGWAQSPDGGPRELDAERCAQELPVEESRVEMDGGERLVAEMDARAREGRKPRAVGQHVKGRVGHIDNDRELQDTAAHEAVAELE